MPLTIDFNCDLGEGGGADGELMPWITSANIACGGHAGDVATMRETVAMAAAHGVAVGAHPGEHGGVQVVHGKPYEAPVAVRGKEGNGRLAASHERPEHLEVDPAAPVFSRREVGDGARACAR